MMNILDWHTYLNHLREMLDNMMKPHEFTEVTLNCDYSEEFKVHKIVLSACSPLFKSIINNPKKNMGTLKNPVLYLKGIKQQEMDSILESVYLNLAKYHEERMKEFLTMAKSFHTKVKVVEVSEPNDSMMVVDCDKNLEGFTVNFLSNTMDIKENHDTKITTVKDENNRRFACNQCDKAYSAETSLQRHVRATHEGFKHSCNECDKHYTDQTGLRHHMNVVHKGILYNCKQCPYGGTTPFNLQSHIESVHEGVRYPCNKCDFLAKNQGHLKVHIQSQHTQSPQKHNLSVKSINTPVAKKVRKSKYSNLLVSTEPDLSKSVPTYKMPKQITMTKVPAYQVPKQITQNRQISFSRI